MLNKRFKCTVKTLAGLEEVLLSELEAIGIDDAKSIRRAVQFETDMKGLYKVNLKLHTALSVLVSVANFRYKDKNDIYNEVFKLPWETLFDVNQTFSVKATVFSKAFNNTQYPALLVKDAIADRFRKQTGKRPNVGREMPDIVVDVYINEQFCTISLNSSGQPLYMRGYRNMGIPAPLNECLAAGMILLSGWKAGQNFIDPMCGSGTLSIEAALMASQTFPQKMREDFSFKNWKGFDKEMFAQLLDELNSEIKTGEIGVYASDISNRAVSITRNSLRMLDLEEKVHVRKIDFFKSTSEVDTGTVVLNPPYDERMQEEDIEGFYKKIGDALKEGYSNHEAWILSSNNTAMRAIGLKPFKKINLFNGKIPCEFAGYDLYHGTKREFPVS